MGTLVPVVRVIAPHRSLLFMKSGDAIRGGLQISVTAWTGDGQIGGGVAREWIEVHDWSDGESDSLLTVDVPILLDPVQDAELSVRAVSLGSARSWSRQLECRLVDWQGVPLEFVDFTWSLPADRILSVATDTLRVSLTVRGPAPDLWPSEPVFTACRLVDPLGDFSLTARVPLDPGADSGPEAGREDLLVGELVVPVESLPFGGLDLTPLLEVGSGPKARVRPWLPVRALINLNPDFVDDRHWEDQINWLDGKVELAVRRELAAVPAPERAAAWLRAWQGRSSDSSAAGAVENAEHHLRLVVAADEKFSGYDRGSFTDRGLIYIRYGPPDLIDLAAEEAGRDSRWETWYYRAAGLEVTFLDSHGLGEFRLMGTRPW